MTVLSLEPWDDVWRRNQHFARRLVDQGHAGEVVFVAPPRRHPTPAAHPHPGIRTHQPCLLLPKRLGGLSLAARGLRTLVRDSDVLWVNDPVMGALLADAGTAVVYDVTDDWRLASQAPAVLARLVSAEDRLAGAGRTVVCSDVLAARWRERYGVEPTVVPNGVDVVAVVAAASGPRMHLDGASPHVGYVGTLHDERLDVPAVLQLADLEGVGTVHLVGPDALTAASRLAFQTHPSIRLHGPVSSVDVPRWTTSLDVLLCPHVVTPFTLSLDAIKAHEYLATGKPVVATPTSGFQSLTADGLWVVGRSRLADAVRSAISSPGPYGSRGAADWDIRVESFASALVSAVRENG